MRNIKKCQYCDKDAYIGYRKNDLVCSAHYSQIKRHGQITERKIGTINKKGYKVIVKGNTKFPHKRYLEHRMIMELHIGRKLSIDETIHHINGNKLDNKIENLQIISRSEHGKIHAKERGLGIKIKRKTFQKWKKTEEQLNEMVALRNKGLSFQKIAILMKINQKTVYKYIKNLKEINYKKNYEYLSDK